ncbi:hypothetical protein BTS2_3337 [Bacillus sp. TS-2]|nr:hypothetical protein BTS2_3337 [Bacillus sp. TS-2]
MILNDEEYNLVESFILFPFALAVLEKDLEKFKQVTVKYPDIYIERIEKTIIQIRKRLRDVKKELRKKNITIYEIERVKMHSYTRLNYDIYLRGHKEQLFYFSYVINIRVKEILQKYFNY